MFVYISHLAFICSYLQPSARKYQPSCITGGAAKVLEGRINSFVRASNMYVCILLNFSACCCCCCYCFLVVGLIKFKDAKHQAQDTFSILLRALHLSHSLSLSSLDFYDVISWLLLRLGPKKASALFVNVFAFNGNLLFIFILLVACLRAREASVQM